MSGSAIASGAVALDTLSSVHAFVADGCLRVPSVLDREACWQVARWIDNASLGAGTRQALSLPGVAQIAHEVRLHPAIAPLLPPGAVAVQCTFFRKSVERNWLVAMHQDLTIPVRERVATGGLRGWSKKEGAWFVQAPQDVLERMVAVCLHLDDCGPEDGPLRVVPGSHDRGIIAGPVSSDYPDELRECLAECGDVWVMRPLLLHASSKAKGQSARRVLHLLFGPPQLPLGLRWRHAM